MGLFNVMDFFMSNKKNFIFFILVLRHKFHFKPKIRTTSYN